MWIYVLILNNALEPIHHSFYNYLTDYCWCNTLLILNNYTHTQSHWWRALSCAICRWFTVPISHKPKSIYFQLSLFFSCMEKAWTSLITILLQLATDASLHGANPNCTWWAKLIALVLPDLPTAVRGNFSHSPSQTLIQTHTYTHTHCAPQYLKIEGSWGHWEWG